MAGKSIWSDAVIARLKSLHSDDMAFSKIAEILNREFKIKLSRNAAIGKARRLGLVTRKPQPNSVVTPRRPRVRRAMAYSAPRKSTLDLADEMLARDPVQDLPPDESTFAVTFDQLRDPHCRWPLGDPSTATFQYCGAEKMKEGPYCARHHRLAYHKHVRLTEDERLRRSHQARQNLGVQKLTA